MKLLLFLLISSLAVGLHAQIDLIDNSIELVRGLRDGSVFGKLKMKVASKILRASDGQNTDLFYEVNRKAFAILEATVPVNANPAPAKLKELSGALAQSVRNVGNAWDWINKTADGIYAVASNNALLTSTQPVDGPSPSKFASGLKSSDASRDLYTLAAFTRCIVDEAKSKPKMKKQLMEALENFKQMRDKCERQLSMSPAHDSQRLDLMGKMELLEFFSSDKNVESVVNDFWLLMKAIKKPSSYDSEAELLSNVEGSRRLRAIIVLLQETRRCMIHAHTWQSQYTKEMSPIFFHAMKVAFATEAPETGDLQVEWFAVMGKFAQLDVDRRISLMNEFGPGSNFSKCMMPASVKEQIERMTPVFNGVEADEAKMLAEVAKLCPTAHSIFVLFYEHFHALRNRHGMNQEANTFLTQLFTKWNEYRQADGSTEEGKAIQARTFAELRSSFIGLSNDTKKIFAHHFPHRTVALLSALF